MSSEVHPKCTSSSGAGSAPRGRQLFAHIVFDGLHVVIDALLDHLDCAGRAGSAGAAASATAQAAHRGWSADCSSDGRACLECEKPQGFDPDAFADQGGFAEEFAQRIGSAGVAAVDRGDRAQSGWVHDFTRYFRC